MSQPKRVVFSRAAVRRLQEIAAYTGRQFGTAQVARYEALLRLRIEEASRGTAHLRTLDTLSGQDRHSQLKVLRAGEHFIVVSETNTDLRIIEIIHTRRDLRVFDPSDGEP